MAETTNLKLFRPGTDDNVGLESSLDQNFQIIDSKLGNALNSYQNKEYASLGELLSTKFTEYDKAAVNAEKAVKRQANAAMDNRMIRSIAHRGFSAVAPENTLSAFRNAVDAGFDGIEFDVQVTSDGKYVVIHDATVDRTSSGTGSVAAMTLNQLKALDFGSWYSSVYKDERIPTLEDTLFLCKMGQVVPYLELKFNPTDVQTQEIVNMIKKIGMEDSTVIIGATMANLQKVRDYSSRIAIGYVVSSITQFGIDNTVALGNAFMDAKIDTITEANFELVRKAGLELEAWTIDKNSDLRKLVKMGIRGITTNKITWTGGY